MKNNYNYLGSLFTLFFLLSINVHAQNIQWAQNMGKNLIYTRGTSITNDKLDNIYTVGKYTNNSFDINSGIDTCILTYNGGDDIFILKSNIYGDFIWAKGIGGKRSESPYSVSTDDSGNVYVAGVFQDTVDFDPGIGSNILTALGTNVFILKLNSTGNFVWVKNIPVNLNYSKIEIIVDKKGDIIISGNFIGITDFDPGVGIFNLVPNNNTITMFVLKLNNQGNFIFAKKLGTGYSYGMCLDTSGNIYTTGSITAISDFDPDTGVYNLTANGTFISKLNTNGNFVWAIKTAAQALSICVDDSANVYTCGTFTNKINFNPKDTFISLGSLDFYILKLDINGNYVWADKFGGTQSDDIKSIILDKNRNIYSVGSFGNVVDFDPGIGILNYTANGDNGNDVFLLKLNNNGQFLSVKKMGGYGSDNGNDITIDNKNSIIITGSIHSSKPDFDSIPGKYVLNLLGSEDVFIANFSNCNLGITKQPSNKTITAGANTFFNAGSSSNMATFQWQWLSKNGFINLSNNNQFIGTDKDSFYVLNATQDLNNNKFRCVVSDNGCKVITDTITLKVNCDFNIKKQPLSQLVSVDKNAIFSIELNKPSVSSQWQQKIGNSFINIEDNQQFLGSNRDSLFINNVLLNQNKTNIRCLTSLNNCFLVSDTVTLIVNCVKLIKTQPNNKALVPGSSIIYVVKTFSPSCTFQWQWGSGTSYYNLSNSPFINGVDNDSLIVSNVQPLLNNRSIYRCIVSDKECLDTSIDVAIYFVGVKELQSNSITVFPNPVSNTLTIKNDNLTSGVRYHLTDIIGSEVLTGILTNNSTMIDITNLKNGLYFLNIGDIENLIFKIFKE